MSERKQSKTVDTVIITVCLLLLIVCGTLLSNNKFFSGDEDTSKLKAVGQISSTSNDVRRRHHDDLSWNSASKSDIVFEGDSVYTGDTSNADITLQKGGKLTLDPKSLVVIKTEGDNLTLDLKYGAFGGNVTGDQHIIVINNGERSVISGHNAKIRVEQKPGEKPHVHVISGELKIKNKAGEEKTVKKDQDLEIQKEIAKIAPTPIFPTQDQLFITNDTPQGRKVAFTWKDTLAAKKYMVEVSKTPGFDSVVLRQDLTAKSTETEKLASGSYFWRVRGEDPGSREPIWSQSVPFQVLEHSAMKAPTLSRANQPYIIPFSLVDLRHVDEKQTSVQSPSNPSLSWAPSAQATSYDLQVTSSNAFSPNQIVNVGDVTSYQIKDLQPGTYSYRVRAVLPAGQKSETSAVAVLKVELPAPIAHKPSESITAFKIAWTPLLFASAYEVQVSPDLSFTTHKAILSKSGQDQILKSLYAKEGGLHWRVRALNSNRVAISEFSEPQTLRTKALVPLAKADTTIRTPASDDAGANELMMIPQLLEPRPDTSVLAMAHESSGYISFRWKAQADPGAVYRLEVSQSPDFKNPVIKKTTHVMNAVIVQRLPAGQMYWRVRQESPKGHSRWATPNAMSVSPQ